MLHEQPDLKHYSYRSPKGGRSTDADDYPPERTAYAMRAPDRIVSQALKLGPSIGRFAERLRKAARQRRCRLDRHLLTR